MSGDAELLAAWVGGDQSAGKDLFQRYYPIVARFFANKAGAEAAELVQQTFVRCLESHARFEGRSTFRVFLLGIARNVFFKHLRARYKHERVDFGVTSLSDWGATPTRDIARREDERKLLLALQRIPIEQQVLLELYFWENMQGRELAELYGVPEGTIRSRLLAARQRLATEFEALGAVPLQGHSGALETWAAELRQRLTET